MKCIQCNGSGMREEPGLKTIYDCPRCGGTGKEDERTQPKIGDTT